MAAQSPADEFPIAGVRFVNGRTRHRVRRPVDQRWWDLLYAACGKTGHKTDAYVLGTVRDCTGCEAAVRGDSAQAA
ncbi:hypothetical protein AB0N99_30815 [Streptomyces sp. NPDC093272]|uniref:hypothetical protein n=1 Tax=Streptomyces sp. NPDC093272 TaxID=3154981 RepID=UPI00342393AA